MIVSKIRECYDDHTQSLSKVNRQLCFAGIAIVWIFATGSESSHTLPGILLFPLFFFTIALSLDLAQYIFLSVKFDELQKACDQLKLSEEADYELHDRTHDNACFCFYGKVLANISGFTSLFLSMMHLVNFN